MVARKRASSEHLGNERVFRVYRGCVRRDRVDLLGLSGSLGNLRRDVRLGCFCCFGCMVCWVREPTPGWATRETGRRPIWTPP
jgi:hypothetical protein